MPTSGGMTVYNSLGYDPSQPQGGGINWGSVIGTGLQSTGKAISGAQSPIPQYGSLPSMGQLDVATPNQPTNPIPQNNLMDALLRILSGS